MKYAFYVLIILLPLTAFSQNSSRSVVETTNDDSYRFTVKLDKRQDDVLLHTFEKLRGGKLKLKVVGVIVEEYANGVSLRLDTRRNKLTVLHDGTDETGREEAFSLVTAAKDELNLTTPTPPRPDRR